MFLLHRYPEFMDSCADLLNQQWPRSKTARLHSLGKSCDTLPCSLVLVSVGGHQSQVIGHSMLSQVIGIEDACFVESVLVDPQLRGKGLGRWLMEASEDYAASLGYRTVYLSTHDKQGFYGHLGYEFCEPISKLDSCTKLLPAGLLKQLGMSSSKQNQRLSPKDDNSKNIGKTDLDNRNNSAVSLPSKNVPTPPPLINIPKHPPPPPPLTAKTGLEIVKMDPNQICWMKKELHKNKLPSNVKK